MRLKTALIGYGYAGSVFHAPLIAATAGLELSTIVTGDRDRAAAARRSFPDARIEAEVDAVFERATGHDLVVVASPNDSHVEIATRAVELGIPVVVDKPLAPTADAAAGLVERAERAGVPLTVFQNRRWDSDHLTLRRLIEADELGEVLRYESRFERWRPRSRGDAWRQTTPPETGGGLALDLCTHLVDQAVMLFGAPRAVYAEFDHRRGGPADDDVFIALEHRTGTRSHLWASDFAAAPGPRLRVLGSSASFVIDSLDGQEEALRAGTKPQEDPSWGVESRSDWGSLYRSGDDVEAVVPERGDWPGFYAGVVTALVTEGRMPVDPRVAVEVLRVLESAREGGNASPRTGESDHTRG